MVAYSAPHVFYSAESKDVADRQQEAVAVFSYLIVTGAPGLFFFSAWLLMIFAGIVANDVGIRPFGYVTSMIVTIGLWLVVAPLAMTAARRTRRR